MARPFPLVEVRGLKGFQRDLKEAGDGLEKALQVANKRLAEAVAVEARSRAYPAVSQRAKASIRAQASGREARIVAGGPKAPEFFGQEFGGGARPRTRQFPKHRGTEGYFLYPTIRRRLKSVAEEYDQFIADALAERAFPS